MTGRTTARAAGGGSSLKTAFISDRQVLVPIVFEEGTTWRGYVNSDYRLYYSTSEGKFGISGDGTANRVVVHWIKGYNYVSENYATVGLDEQIKPDFTYGTTT